MGHRAKPHVARASGKFEWYTPDWILNGVRRTLGDIDLDPASCDEAQRRVQAKEYFTMADDGLSKPWFGRVFMNPPYARYLVDKFATKWTGEWMADHITEGVVLVNNATETEWYQMLALTCVATCELRGRVKFVPPGAGKANKGLQGQVLLYYGADAEKFRRVWDRHGQVYLAVGNGLQRWGDEVVRQVYAAKALALQTT